MKFAMILFGVSVSAVAGAATWYVDSENGSDAAAGTSAESAVQSLECVNKLDVQPGDKVLFRRGGLWRGTLCAKSGAPGKSVLYSSYGDGPKPVIQRSIDRSKPSDWVQEGINLWATKKCIPPRIENQLCTTEQLLTGWGSSYQEGNKGAMRIAEENGMRFVRVTLDKKVKAAPHLLQLWGPRLQTAGEALLMRLKVRSTKMFKMSNVAVTMNSHPWTKAFAASDSAVDVTPGWQNIDVLFERKSDLREGNIHFSIGDVMPEGAVFDFIPEGVWNVSVDESNAIPADVGIFICNHGEKWGVKKWFKPDWEKAWPNSTNLINDLDYYYNPGEQRVFVKYPKNPGEAFDSIELALTRAIVNENNCHDVVYDGLAIRYGGAHGFGGGCTRNIVIRNCDIYWMGGGLQFWKKNEKTGKISYPVRFGNGIEFWGHCHNNLVERNRLWQIYDAALTNQTNGDPRHETDVTWRDNVVWQAEYSFEYWNHDLRSYTGNILVEHNTFVDAGYCWSHNQRPDRNGAHLMMYDNAAPTTNFVVRNNLFVRTTDRSTRFFNDWRVKNKEANDGISMHRNLYWIPENMVCQYHVNGREKAQKPQAIRLEPGKWGAGEAEFKRYQAEFGLDRESVYGEPQFVNEAKRDYRLKPGSFGTNLATDGGPLGARNMPGLDRDQSR